MTEIVHGYGFLAVFVTALTFGATHREHDSRHDMHDVTEQIERLAMMVLLLLFGGALVSGLLASVGWREVTAAFATCSSSGRSQDSSGYSGTGRTDRRS